VLKDPEVSALLGRVAIYAHANDRARIAVTDEIVQAAWDAARSEAEPMAWPIVDRQFETTTDMYTLAGLYDLSLGRWMGTGRLNLNNLGPGDQVAIEAAIEFADHYIITLSPDSLDLTWLEDHGIGVITPEQLLRAGRKQIPRVVQAAMDAHRERMGASKEVYAEFLRTAGLGKLLPLIPTAD
jgi:hypothetical protein